MELFFDTETSDKFEFKSANYRDKNFPWIVQLAAVLAHEGIAYAEINFIVMPEGRTIAEGAQRVHNIDVETAEKFGIKELLVLNSFMALMDKAETIVAHNFVFDSTMIASVMYRNGYAIQAEDLLYRKPCYCTMQETTELCKLLGKYGHKWPKLQELHQFLFHEDFVGAHDAMFDIRATMKCYYKLKEDGWIK